MNTPQVEEQAREWMTLLQLLRGTPGGARCSCRTVHGFSSSAQRSGTFLVTTANGLNVSRKIGPRPNP